MSSKDDKVKVLNRVESNDAIHYIEWRGAKGRVYRLCKGVTLQRRGEAGTATVVGFTPDGTVPVRVLFRQGRPCSLGSLEYEYDLDEHKLDGVPVGELVKRGPTKEEKRDAFFATLRAKRATLSPEQPMVDSEQPDGTLMLEEADTLRPPAEEATERPTAIVERVDLVKGWDLAVLHGENQPRVSHRELADRLGYGDAKDVLAVADSALGDDWRSRVPNAESRREFGRPQISWFFSRRETLEIAVLSRTARAAAVRSEVLDVYEAWLEGRLSVSPAPSPPAGAPWDMIKALASGAVELRADVTVAKEQATQAHVAAEKASRDAAEAKAVAEQARTMAGSRVLLEGLEPGKARHTPDGAFSALRPDGFLSMAGVARRYALPRSGEGRLVVAKVAEALGVFEIEGATTSDAVVIGGRERGLHRLYGPKALEALDRPLRTAFGMMGALGFTTTVGGAMVAKRTGTKSKAWVIKQMVDAAIAPTDIAAKAAQSQQDLFGKAS